MKFYKILDDKTFGGVIELNQLVAPTGYTEVDPIEYNHKKIFENGVWLDVIEPVVEISNRKLSKLDYMKRFKDVELENIYTAAKTVVKVEIWLDKFKVADEINLDDPEIIKGLESMETLGLIDTGRAAEILA